MFKIFEIKKENVKLKEKVKSQALENTSLARENDQLRWKLKKIQLDIKDFNSLKDNPFTLFNKIRTEVDGVD